MAVWRSRASARDQHEAELHAARRAQVCELAPADVNRDGVLDMIVGFGPTMKDRPGTRYSTLEAYDGKTNDVLWTSRLPRWLQCEVVESRQSVVVGPEHVAFTWTAPQTSPQGDGIAALSVHEIATGRLVWQTSFPASSFWVGLPFRVWLAAEQLLVLTNTDQDRSATTDHVLHAFDLATGAKRWEQPITRAASTPWTVDGTIALMAGPGLSATTEPAHLVFIDATSGTTSKLPVAKHGWRAAVVGTEDLLLRCESLDSVCEAILDPSKPPPDPIGAWLARVDLRTRAFRPVTLADGSPQPLAFDGDRLARYNDMVIEGTGPGGWLTAFRLGDAAIVWTLDGARLPLAGIDDRADRATPAAHLHAIPGRYLPLFADVAGAHRLVILDLQTGTPVWKSEPLPPHRDERFVVHGARYHVNVVLDGASILLVIDGNTGTFVAADQIAVGGESASPNELAFQRQADARSFRSGRLLGHRAGPAWWMIDLATGTLTASPGVALVSRWADAERVLGPLPRSLGSR